ncbi:M15 family metallopeptidase [Eubacteriaceae bacterium ES3]|nr:M15 family metallopeptidase [Eubacteriaceae bacterium ES3]
MRIVNRKKFLITTIGLLLIVLLIITLITVNVYNRMSQANDQVVAESENQANENKNTTTITTQTEANSQTTENAEVNETTQTETQVQTSDTSSGSLGASGIFTEGSITQVANKQYALSSSYIPDDLTWLDLPATRDTQMRAEAAAALTELFNAAQNQGITLYCCSGYRSYETQADLYQWNVDTYGQAEADLVSAKPGTSEHQLGLAMDVTSESVGFDLLESFGQTEEGQFVKANAYKYGFIIRYPQGKTGITGYSYEPWHLRYVGVDVATDIYNSGLTMEEYYGLV